jgi:deoxycytidylate deaminase
LAIANAGVSRVVVATTYRPEEGPSGLAVLERGGIQVDHLALSD